MGSSLTWVNHRNTGQMFQVSTIHGGSLPPETIVSRDFASRLIRVHSSRLRRPKVLWLASSSGTRSRKAKWGRKRGTEGFTLGEQFYSLQPHP